MTPVELESAVLAYLRKTGGSEEIQVRRGGGLHEKIKPALNRLVKAGKLRIGVYGNWRRGGGEHAKWQAGHYSGPSHFETQTFTVYWPIKEVDR